jgi:hypothetical protein
MLVAVLYIFLHHLATSMTLMVLSPPATEEIEV